MRRIFQFQNKKYIQGIRNYVQIQVYYTLKYFDRTMNNI